MGGRGKVSYVEGRGEGVDRIWDVLTYSRYACRKPLGFWMRM